MLFNILKSIRFLAILSFDIDVIRCWFKHSLSFRPTLASLTIPPIEQIQIKKYLAESGFEPTNL